MLALFALGVVAALPQPAAAAPAADAGALRAVVQDNPWRLTLVDRAGRPVLSEDPSTGPGPAGTLGFRTGGAWRHATRVIDSRRRRGAYVAELATTDPLRTIRVRIDRSAGGVIALDAELLGPPIAIEAIGMGFSAQPGERYLGFGERSNAVDQRGGIVENSSRTARTRPRSTRSSMRSCRHGACVSVETPPTFRSPGCCQRPAMACWSTTRRRATSASMPGAPALGASRSRGRLRASPAAI